MKGTAGSRVLTGPQIRAALGLRDTWMTFVRVSSSVRRGRSARVSAYGARVEALELAGRFSPAPRRRRLTR